MRHVAGNAPRNLKINSDNALGPHSLQDKQHAGLETDRAVSAAIANAQVVALKLVNPSGAVGQIDLLGRRFWVKRIADPAFGMASLLDHAFFDYDRGRTLE